MASNMASSTSKCVLDVQDGCHVMSIDHFLDRPKKRITSADFAMAGHRWRMIVHPHGDGDTEDHASVFLQLVNAPANEPLRAKYHFARGNEFNLSNDELLSRKTNISEF